MCVCVYLLFNAERQGESEEIQAYRTLVKRTEVDQSQDTQVILTSERAKYLRERESESEQVLQSKLYILCAALVGLVELRDYERYKNTYTYIHTPKMPKLDEEKEGAD